MQLDAEASFVSQEEVLAFISVAVSAAVEEVTGQKMGDVPRMTWQEAQERFGSDKPDIRFGMELIELTPNFASTEFNAFKADCIKGIVVEGGAEFTRSKLDELTENYINISTDQQQLTITLPPSKVLSVDVDVQKSRVVAREQGFLAKPLQNIDIEALQAGRQLILQKCTTEDMVAASEPGQKCARTDLCTQRFPVGGNRRECGELYNNPAMIRPPWYNAVRTTPCGFICVCGTPCGAKPVQKRCDGYVRLL